MSGLSVRQKCGSQGCGKYVPLIGTGRGGRASRKYVRLIVCGGPPHRFRGGRGCPVRTATSWLRGGLSRLAMVGESPEEVLPGGAVLVLEPVDALEQPGGGCPGFGGVVGGLGRSGDPQGLDVQG